MINMINKLVRSILPRRSHEVGIIKEAISEKRERTVAVIERLNSTLQDDSVTFLIVRANAYKTK